MGFLRRIFSKGGGKKDRKEEPGVAPRPHSANSSRTDDALAQEWTYIDPEAAVSRLLRSSSSRYNIVAEVDYSNLPPIPHPIDSISRSTFRSAAPSSQASVQSRNTYTVKILAREQHSLTEFPNAYPPLPDSSSSAKPASEMKLRKRNNFDTIYKNDPENEHEQDKATHHDNFNDNDKDCATEQRRDLSIARAQDNVRQHRFNSTPNLLLQSSAPPSSYATPRPPRTRQNSDPRRIPFTPHDNNRLSRLRQDPSVASLLSMYDEKGQLGDKVFSNTPPHAIPIPKQSKQTLRIKDEDVAKRERRASTFKELMSVESNAKKSEGEGDLSWAERCIAESRTSTSTQSSDASTNIVTPTTTTFDLAARASTDDSHSNGKNACNTMNSHVTIIDQQSCNTYEKTRENTTVDYAAISSMVVELSTAGASTESEGDVNVSNILAGIDDSVRQIKQSHTGSKEERVRSLARTPSKRASQVFSFLNEKRPKRISTASNAPSMNSLAMSSALNLALSTQAQNQQGQKQSQLASSNDARENLIHARPLPVPSQILSPRLTARPFTPTIDTNVRGGLYTHPSQAGSSASFRPLPIPKPSLEQQYSSRLSVADAYPPRSTSPVPRPDTPIETCMDQDMPLPSPWAEPDLAGSSGETYPFPEPPPSPIPSPIIPHAVLAPVPARIPLPPSRACTPVPLKTPDNEPVMWMTADKALAAHEEAEGRAKERIRQEKEKEKRERREIAVSLPPVSSQAQRLAALGLPTPVSAHHSQRLQQLRSPAPAPPSPVAFHPLNPPPRPRRRTGSNSSSTNSVSSFKPHYAGGIGSHKGRSHSTDVVDVAAESARGRSGHVRGGSESNARLSVWEIAQGRGRSPSPSSRPLPIPPVPSVASVPTRRAQGHAHTQSASAVDYANAHHSALRERTNSDVNADQLPQKQRLWQRTHAPSSFGGKPQSRVPRKRSVSPTILAGVFSSLGLSGNADTGLDKDSDKWVCLEKENETELDSGDIRDSSSTGGMGLGRSSSRRSSSLQSLPGGCSLPTPSASPSSSSSNFLSVPGPITSTPYRSRSPLRIDTTSSLIGCDGIPTPTSPSSSSELSPDAQKMMADARMRKAARKGKGKAQTQGRGDVNSKKRISILNLI